MSYAFLIVVSVAITVKLIFLSLSLYFTLKNKEVDLTQASNQTKTKKKSLLISWKQIPRMFIPNSYFPSASSKEFQLQHKS